MAKQEYDAIVIGGGHNGLVTANYLAMDGLKVLVLERLPRIGGAAATEELFPGFHVPYCAYSTYLLNGKIVEDLELRKHGFDVYHPDPGTFHPFPDGTSLLTWNDQRKTYQEIRKFSEHDAQAWFEWNAFWERASGIIYRYFLTDPPTYAQISEDLRGTADEEVWEKMLTVPVLDLAEEYFEHPRVLAAMVNANDIGDLRAPGSMFGTAWTRMSSLVKAENRGIPRGGMQQVSESMARSAQAKGVEIRKNALVRRIIVENGEARGVVINTGEEIRSVIVASNADPKQTYLKMLDPKDLDEGFVKRIRNLKDRSNCVKILAALKEIPDFSRYFGAGYDPRYVVSTRINPSVEYNMASWDAARNGQLPSTPIMHLQFPSLYDRSLAPRGGHVLSIWSRYYPAEPKEGTYDKLRKQIGEQHLDILSEYAPNFRKCVIELTVETPMDIETRIGMPHGNIRHIDMVPQQMFSRRLPYRSPIKNLYLCGSGTHPGGDVTGGPGHNCARAILKDIQVAVRVGV